jgi:hypothetical protein
MKTIIFTLVFLSTIFSFNKVLFAQNYDSTFFPIGVWSVRGDFRGIDDFLFNVETAASFHHTSFQNLKEQGFNSIFMSYDPISYTLDTILDIAEMYDMKVIPPFINLHQLIGSSNENDVTDDEIREALTIDGIDRIRNSPATLGYYLYDEPLQGWIDFEVLERAKDIFIEETNGNHPVLSTWNDEQQMSYIDSYLHPEVLMMDSYPLEDGDAIGDLSDYMPSYFTSMPDPPPFSDYINTVRQNHCESIDRPMWVVFQAFGDMETQENWGFWRQVYPKEIRLQVYLSIMQGAKGLWYFLYESEFPYLLGMLDVSGQPTQRLTEAIAVNAEINKISDILLKLRVVNDSTAVSTSFGEVKMHVDYSSELNDKYIIAVNTDVFDTSVITLSVKKSAVDYAVKSVLNISDTKELSFTENGSTIDFTVQLEPGSGALIKLSDEVSAVETLPIAENIRIFPNPAENSIQIKMGNLQLLKYSIYNTMGSLIIENAQLQNGSIDIDFLNPGVYIIRVNTDKGIINKKFVKK